MSSRASLFLVVIIGAATPQMQAALPSTPTVAAWITPRGGGRTAPSSSSSTSYPAPHPLPSTGLISQPAPRQEAPLSEMTLLSWAALVGAVAAVVSVAYREVLEFAAEFMWVGAPQLLESSRHGVGPWYIIVVMAVGAALFGGLSATLLPGVMGVSEWIACGGDAGARGGTSDHHSLRSRLLATLALPLLVSTAGFSLGPEAPMVCAGGLLGAAVAAAPFLPAAFRSYSRPLSVAGAAGALSAFVGLPLVGACFVLEILSPGER